MRSIAPLTEYPALWLLAAANLAALVVAITGSFALSLKKKQVAWLPIGAAMLVAYGLSWVSKIRSGIVPALPYIAIQKIGSGAQSLPSVTVSYNLDFIALGIALGVIIALKKKE